MNDEQKLMEILNEGLTSAHEEGWIDEDSIKLHFNEKFKKNTLKCSPKLQKELNEIIKLCHEKQEPVYLNNDQCHLVIMDEETFIHREKMLDLKEQFLEVLEERLRGHKQVTIDELEHDLNNIIKKVSENYEK